MRNAALLRALKKAKTVAATGEHAGVDEVLLQLEPADRTLLATSLTAEHRGELKAICEAANVRLMKARAT
jgi:hypothetical protein